MRQPQYNMNHQILEIESKMESHFQAILDLQIEKLKILQSGSEELLRFDDAKKTICWNRDSVRLTAKQYLFIKIVWANNDHEATLDEIDEKVWQAGDENAPFTERHTIQTLINRAQKKLKNCAFPYTIKTIKDFSTRGISGYKLVCAR
jgi:DNA-binding response OmpR family regulator